MIPYSSPLLSPLWDSLCQTCAQDLPSLLLSISALVSSAAVCQLPWTQMWVPLQLLLPLSPLRPGLTSRLSRFSASRAELPFFLPLPWHWWLTGAHVPPTVHPALLADAAHISQCPSTVPARQSPHALPYLHQPFAAQLFAPSSLSSGQPC